MDNFYLYKIYLSLIDSEEHAQVLSNVNVIKTIKDVFDYCVVTFAYDIFLGEVEPIVIIEVPGKAEHEDKIRDCMNQVLLRFNAYRYTLSKQELLKYELK